MHKLRCKVGDLAIFKSNNAGDADDNKLVRVIRRSSDAVEKFLDKPCWAVESIGSPFATVEELDGSKCEPDRFINHPDAQLVPMRNNPGEDESLRWADKPKARRKRRVAEKTAN